MQGSTPCLFSQLAGGPSFTTKLRMLDDYPLQRQKAHPGLYRSSPLLMVFASAESPMRMWMPIRIVAGTASMAFKYGRASP